MSHGPGIVMRTVLALLKGPAWRRSTPRLVASMPERKPQAIYRALEKLEASRDIVASRSKLPGKRRMWELANTPQHVMAYEARRKPNSRSKLPGQLEAPLVGDLFDMPAHQKAEHARQNAERRAIKRIEALLAKLDRREWLDSLNEMDRLRAEFDTEVDPASKELPRQKELTDTDKPPLPAETGGRKGKSWVDLLE